MRKIVISMVGSFMVFCVALSFSTATQVLAATPALSGEKIRAFVSILPQVYFLKRVGGNRVQVSVMVAPGQSLHTYLEVLHDNT